MKNEQIFTEEMLDFMREAMNIGAGNAATALSQMLHCRVELQIPEIHILPANNAPSAIGAPTLSVVCARMKLIGDVTGDIFYIIPESDKGVIAGIGRNAMPLALKGKSEKELDISLISEIGNVVAGVYTTALHDFCGLQIYHTVPDSAVDMLQSVMEEALAWASLVSSKAILIENEIEIGESLVKTYFVIIPTPESLQTLTDVVKETRKAYGGQ